MKIPDLQQDCKEAEMGGYKKIVDQVIADIEEMRKQEYADRGGDLYVPKKEYNTIPHTPKREYNEPTKRSTSRNRKTVAKG